MIEQYFYCNNCDEYGVLLFMPNATQGDLNDSKCSCGNGSLRIVNPKVVMMNQLKKIEDLLRRGK